MLLATGVSADDYADRFNSGWPSASRGLVLVLGLLLAGALLALGISEARKTARRAREAREEGQKAFETQARALDLSSPEIKFLERTFPNSGAPTPDLLLKKIEYFERALGPEIERARPNPLLLKNICETIASLRKKLGYDHVPPGIPWYATREIPEGQELLLVLPDDPGGVRYGSRVRALSEAELDVALPQTGESESFFKSGTELKVSAFKPGDGEYTFHMKVLGPTLDRQGLRLDHTATIARKQLREYVRLEIRNQAKYRFVRAEQAPDRTKGGPRFSGILLDISGGGCLLQAAEEYNAGDVVMMSFNFMGEAFYGVKGKVLRISPKSSRTEAAFNHHIQFTEIENNVRERIIRLIFDKQREDLQWQKSAPGQAL